MICTAGVLLLPLFSLLCSPGRGSFINAEAWLFLEDQEKLNGRVMRSSCRDLQRFRGDICKDSEATGGVQHARGGSKKGRFWHALSAYGSLKRAKVCEKPLSNLHYFRVRYLVKGCRFLPNFFIFYFFGNLTPLATLPASPG